METLFAMHVAQHGFYAGAFGTPSNFVNAGWPWYNAWKFRHRSLRSGRCRKNLPLCVTVEWNLMRYHVDSVIGTDRMGGRNDSLDIPVGSVFTRVVKTRVDGDPMNLQTVELGHIATLSITLVAVEHFGHSIDYIPADHSPLLFVDDDVAALADLLDACGDREYLHLIVNAK